MTIREFYAAIGGDYDDVMARLRMEGLVQRFVQKFKADGSYQLLCDSLAAGDYAEAFRAAHTLKGVCQNLSFTPLHHTAHELTELLRDCEPHDCSELMDKLKQSYQTVIDAIEQLDS
ncbi:MAG: Hpt domain-containing protein [Roseburia sp.]|nr:Hpt domain-containing protein [Roseburia sp.]